MASAHKNLSSLDLPYLLENAAELDRFKGRGSGQYSDREIEEFRYVMYTMRQDEVREWMECLQAREIELPDELKEECYSMMNEIE